MSDFFLILFSFSVGFLLTAPLAYKLGKLIARRECADNWRRENFSLVKWDWSPKPAPIEPVENKPTSNVYEFPIGRNL